MVKKAKETGARSVAYTYVEPTIFYEYMLDTAQHVKKTGLLNVFHSNGYINPEPLRNLCKVLDGANIDLNNLFLLFEVDRPRFAEFFTGFAFALQEESAVLLIYHWDIWHRLRKWYIDRFPLAKSLVECA